MLKRFTHFLLLSFVPVLLAWPVTAAEKDGYATVTLYQSVGGVGGISHDASAGVTSVDFFYVPENSSISEFGYEIVSQPTKGRAVDNGNGTFTFHLDTDFDGLASASSETVTIRFRETNSSAENDIYITVTGVTNTSNQPATPVVVAETTGDSNGDGQINTVTGDAVEAPVTTTFRPLPTVSASGQTSAAATPADGQNGQQDVSARFSGQGGRSAAGLLGTSSSVAVSGSPNQAYGISLPGKTSYVAGEAAVSIEKFIHDAGTTPSVRGDGRTVFNLGTQAPTGGQTTGGSTGQSSGEAQQSASAGTAAAPVVTQSPFVNITISYN
jgi:hypothetical protein